nr:extracellular solute-binding protein [uncultured Acetatifactor sp.]
MKKWKKGGRWIAAMLVTALLAGSLSGCGKAAGSGAGQSGESGAGKDSAESGGSSQGAQNEGSSGQGKGRYVEIQESLPQELADWSILQMYQVDEKLRFLAVKAEGGKAILREWEKQGESYADVTGKWLASMEIACMADWMDARLAQGGDGTQYLYAGYIAEGEDDFKPHLWKSDGDQAVEITPQKWTVPDEELGSYEMVQGFGVLDNGTLVALSYTSLDILSAEDGKVIESEKLTTYYEGGVISDGENIYLRVADGSGGRIEKRQGGKAASAVQIPYPAGESAATQSGDSGMISFGGGASLALAALPDGTLIAGSKDGLFRRSAGDGEGQWELLVSGQETDFAMAECTCMDFAAFQDGTIYALFGTESGQKLNRYEYDPEAVSEVSEVLNLYTVFQSTLLEQAAAKYHKAHPEVLVKIQSMYSAYYGGETDYNAVYQQLNTMLMGDDAPDIVVMDHLDMDSYADKGLLVDLEDVVGPLEESGELLSNITGVYKREDGKRYAVPLLFAVNLALGRDISAKDMAAMESLADFLSRTDEKYMTSQTVDELVHEFYPYFCNEIVADKQLNREALGRYLDYLKAIGDSCGVIVARPEDEVDNGIFDLTGKAKLAFGRVAGFGDCMFSMSMVDYIKGDFAAFENRFEPLLQAGICSKSQHVDRAKDFLRFALSEETQDLECDGFPVNQKSMESQAAKDHSNNIVIVTLQGDDGSSIQFESKPYSKETAKRLTDMCQSLDKPVGEDAMISQVLTESLRGYLLDGSQSKEDTIQKIEDSLKMYLAE